MGISELERTQHPRSSSTDRNLELRSSMSVQARDIPTSETIAAVSKLELRDEKGQAVTFGSLFEDKKTVIIFIRTCSMLPASLLCSV